MRTLLALAVGLLLLLGPVLAADEVVLLDGSHLVGTVKTLRDQGLRVKTAHLGTLTIPWKKVAELETAAALDVRLASGERLRGTLSADAGHLTVHGEEDLRVERAAVAWIGSDGSARRFSAAVDLGTSLVRGNSEVSQLNLASDLGYTTRRYESRLRFTSIVNQQDGADDTRRGTVDLSFDRVPKRWRVGGFLSLEQDEKQFLDLRTLLGVTVGRQLLHSPARHLDLSAGIALAREEFETLAVTEDFEGVLTLDFHGKIGGGTHLGATLSVLPRLEQLERYRVRFDATLRFDLVGALKVSLVAFDRFDSMPPVAAEKNDYGVSVGLGYSH